MVDKDRFMSNFTVINTVGSTRNEIMNNASRNIDALIEEKLESYKKKALEGNVMYITMYNNLIINRNAHKQAMLRFVEKAMSKEFVKIDNDVKTTSEE